jgi:ParB/RepB/Spo0J family partition protein
MKTPKTTRTFVEVDITDIVSAVENLRDAAPRLSAEGFGIFEGTDKQQESLVSLALSQDSLQKRKYVNLIEEHEPDIEALADNMATMGLLEPIRVRPADEKGTYDLIFGCRRCLGWLYIHAKSAGKVPARVTAEIVEAEGKDSLLSSLSENIRVEPSPIDEANCFRKLEKTFCMKAAEIASATGKDVKVVRERLKLLKLPPELQQKVHLGKLAQKKALAFLDGDKGKATVPPSDPRRLPSIKDIEHLYHAPKDQLPEEYEALVGEEVRRLFAHWLRLTYKPRAEPPKKQTTHTPKNQKA